MLKRLFIGFLMFGSIATGAISGLPSGAATSFTQPPSKVGVATSTPVPAAVRNARFVNQIGLPETLGALKGKTVFVVPLLTLCGDTCPFTSGNLLQLQSKILAAKASNVEVVAIDVDPYRDTQARIAAYSKLIGANFQIWTESGSTTTPFITDKEFASKNPIGKGDKNPNLTIIEKFLGWTVQVVPQSVPAPTDWMAPHDLLSYDINHSDGFWIIGASQSVRFVSGDLPAFTGTLSKVLSTFMGYKSNIYNSPVFKGGWTPSEAVQALEWVANEKLS
jgi:cytochrome oxidase Cu insertion factor (SCO1/SenC/PrrC family)